MRGLILGLAIVVAGCGGDAPEQQAAPTPQPLSDIQQQVAALGDAQRNVVFIRALRDAGRDCQGVTKSERRDEVSSNGTPTWIATCQGGANWVISITRDGTAQVVGAR